MPIDEPPRQEHHEVQIAERLIAERLGVSLGEAEAAMCSYASLAAAPLDAVARDIIELHSSMGRPANDSVRGDT